MDNGELTMIATWYISASKKLSIVNYQLSIKKEGTIN